MSAGPLPSIFDAVSREAVLLAEVAWVLVAGGLLIYAGTMLLLVLAARQRRDAPDLPAERLHRHPGPSRLWITGGGLVFPVVVLAGLLIYATLRTAGLERASVAAPRVVGITARMWWWEVRYRDPRSGREFALANELHLPVGEPVQIGLSSADVIHSFWVPQLGGKMDATPGHLTRLTVTARIPGTYRGQCAEYCGEQHARMALHAVVRPAAEHARWLEAQALPARAAATETARRGQGVFIEHGCAACHTIRGVAEQGWLGPDLTHVGSRLALGAGTLVNQPGAMAAWIAGVQSLKSGAHMPALRDLDAAQLQALAAYLEGLQ